MTGSTNNIILNVLLRTYLFVFLFFWQQISLYAKMIFAGRNRIEDALAGNRFYLFLSFGFQSSSSSSSYVVLKIKWSMNL